MARGRRAYVLNGDTGAWLNAQHMLALLDRYRTPDMTGNNGVPKTVYRGGRQPQLQQGFATGPQRLGP